MTHRLNLVLLALALIVCTPFYWFFLENPSHDVAPYPITITQLRRLADGPKGPRPTEVQLRLVGWKRLPGNLLAAGSGMKRRLYSVMSFSLLAPGQAPVVIESGTGRKDATKAGLEHYDARKQSAIDQVMSRARLILATSEDPDHLGGLAQFAGNPQNGMSLTRARLNPFQVPAQTADDDVDWPPNLVLRAAFSGTDPVAVAPGIVVIPSPAHTPGSQMVYVALANGREYLFAGDVAPMALNWERLRLKSRFFAGLNHPEDRTALMRWLVTIAALKRAAPDLIVVPGHDYEWITNPDHHTGIEPL